MDYIPADVKQEGRSVGIDVRYETTGQRIFMHKKFYIDFLLLNPDQFNEWNESVKRISEVYKEAIILKKKQ